jgi:N-carbamoylputrescine amidase
VVLRALFQAFIRTDFVIKKAAKSIRGNVMKIKATVCQMHDDPEEFQRDWERLTGHVRLYGSDLILLPEMPFSPWLAWRPRFDPALWGEAVASHDAWIPRLRELGGAAVLGTRPVTRGENRYNEGFVWDNEAGYRSAHRKYYLPREEGYWEADWYRRGEKGFSPIQVKGAIIGFSICTEIWFFQRARDYGKKGIHLIVIPRATPQSSLDKWVAGGQASAVVSGAFSLSSNRVSHRNHPSQMGGRGWIIDPEGEILAVTSAQKPVITMEIDLAAAERAKKTYPRYVKD